MNSYREGAVVEWLPRCQISRYPTVRFKSMTLAYSNGLLITCWNACFVLSLCTVQYFAFYCTGTREGAGVFSTWGERYDVTP